MEQWNKWVNGKPGVNVLSALLCGIMFFVSRANSFCMSFFHKTDSFLGVDIGAGGIKVVELKKVKGRPQLWTYGMADETLDIHPKESSGSPRTSAPMQPFMAEAEKMQIEKKPVAVAIDLKDPRIESYAKLLKETVAASRASSRVATASIPVSYIFHAVVTLPKVDKRELQHHVLSKVKKVLPRPIEEMQVVFQEIPDALPEKEKKDMKMLVTAAPKDIVAFFSAIFQKAGIRLQDLETEAFALERALVGRDTATVMVVDIGAERTNFFIMDNGLPMTHRTIRLGGRDINDILTNRLGVDAALTPQIKADLGGSSIPVEPFLSALDPIVKEIQYSFDIFLRQSGNEAKRPEKIILTGGASLFPVFVSHIASATGMKAFVGDPWARTVHQDGIKRILDEIGPRMSVAIGLALRNIV